MTWTSEKPTKPGLYQYRPPDVGLSLFYEIVQSPDGRLVAKVNDVRSYVEISELPGQWRGPITDREWWR